MCYRQIKDPGRDIKQNCFSLQIVMADNKNKEVKARLGDIEIKEFLSQVNVIICEKFIRAKISTDRQETSIGSEVAELVEKTTGRRRTKKAVDLVEGRRIREVIRVRMGTRMGRLRDLDCVVDSQLPPRSACLGMHALKSFGYKIIIGGKMAYQTVRVRTLQRSRNVRAAHQPPATKKKREDMLPFFDAEDGLVLNVDPQEARRIEKGE